nr:flagellar FliJ family protein [uncultured Lichenicoccus sp.]
MSRDPLATLLRIREAALDEAKQHVANALAREQVAALRLADEEAALTRETAAAISPSGGDARVDAFARWLPIGRQAIAKALTVQQTATFAVDQARVVLNLTRAAHRSVETLIEKQRHAADRETGLKLQRESDELASQLRSA